MRLEYGLVENALDSLRESMAYYNILWYDCPVRLILAREEQSCSTPIMKPP